MVSVREWLRHPYAPGMLIVLAIAGVYASSLGAPFLFDDAGAVVNNVTIRDLFSPLVLMPPADGSTTTARPVVNVSFAIDYALHGDGVWGYHAVNIAIHAAAALLLLGVVRRTLRLDAIPPALRESAAPASFCIALLWTLHPLQSETVICIAQRTESLCTLFYLLTAYAFIRGVSLDEQAGPGSLGWRAVSVVACFLGMATKEVMVTAPVFVLLYDRTFVSGSFGAALRRHWRYYGCLAASWIVLLWLLLDARGARGASAGFGLGVSTWDYLLTQAKALLLYARLVLWPHPLVLDYGDGVVRSLADVAWHGAVVSLALLATFWALVRRPLTGFLAGSFFLVLAPSSSVVPLVTQTVAEHRMYLPLAFAVSAWVVLTFRFVRPAAAFLIVVSALYGATTAVRTNDYRSATAIWSDTVAKAPTNARAHNNLAQACGEAGDAGRADEHFARAVALRPDYVSARYNWGVALLERGRNDAAIEQLSQAVRVAPDHADAQLNLGIALMRAQRTAEAVERFAAAVQLRPAADAYLNLGLACAELNRTEDAEKAFVAATRLDPGLAEARFQLGRIAERRGQPAQAEAVYAETLRIAPEHVAAHARLGLLLARADKLDAAAEHFRAIIRLRPDDADAHANLGNVLLLQARPREALASYETALRLRPNDPRTRENIELARQAVR